MRNTKQKKNMFDISGPQHFTTVNWTCPNYRRSVAACLVNGAYALESDRQKNQDCAPAWWKKFHFELKHNLIDVSDSSIFGAIYEFKPPKVIQNSSSAPKIVIAFRGTVLKEKPLRQDLKLDIDIIANDLAWAPRCKIAMRAVEEMVSAVGSQNVCLAGHSLGSAIAMLAGKNMAKRGINLATFLFNPPYLSGSVEWIQNETLKHDIQTASSIFTVAVALATDGCRKKSRDYFAQISSWIPNLFVNSDDIISSGYIGYFEHRERMKKIGAECIGKVVTRNSARVLAFGGQSEPLHLLPSANLVVNSLDRNRTKHLDHLERRGQAHGIRQWWSQDLSLQSKEHHYSYILLI